MKKCRLHRENTTAISLMLIFNHEKRYIKKFGGLSIIDHFDEKMYKVHIKDSGSIQLQCSCDSLMIDSVDQFKTDQFLFTPESKKRVGSYYLPVRVDFRIVE